MAIERDDRTAIIERVPRCRSRSKVTEWAAQRKRAAPFITQCAPGTGIVPAAQTVLSHMFQKPKRRVSHVPATQGRSGTARALLALRSAFTCYLGRIGPLHTRYRGVSREGALARRRRHRRELRHRLWQPCGSCRGCRRTAKPAPATSAVHGQAVRCDARGRRSRQGRAVASTTQSVDASVMGDAAGSAERSMRCCPRRRIGS